MPCHRLFLNLLYIGGTLITVFDHSPLKESVGEQSEKVPLSNSVGSEYIYNHAHSRGESQSVNLSISFESF